VDVYTHVLLTSALAGGEWSASRTGRFTHRGISLRCPLDRRLGGPQIRSGRRGEKKILDPTGTRTPDTSVVHPIASRYTYYAIPAPITLNKTRGGGGETRDQLSRAVFFSCWGRVKLSPLVLRPKMGLLYNSRMVDEYEGLTGR
jgi:hypothetical protein